MHPERNGWTIRWYRLVALSVKEILRQSSIWVILTFGSHRSSKFHRDVCVCEEDVVLSAASDMAETLCNYVASS